MPESNAVKPFQVKTDDFETTRYRSRVGLGIKIGIGIGIGIGSGQA